MICLSGEQESNGYYREWTETQKMNKENVKPRETLKKDILIKMLDLAIMACFALLLVLVCSGGFSFSIFGIGIRAHDTENPAIVFALLSIFRVLIHRNGPLREIQIFSFLGMMVTRLKQLLKGWAPSIILSCLVGTYILIMGATTVMRHLSYNSSGYDLGIFDQIIWNTLHGNILNSSIIGDRHFFGDHFSPILLLLTPLYFIHAHPIILLIFQTIALSSGAIPVYLLAKSKLNSYQLALLFSFLYLCYQPLRNVNLYDFHSIALACPLLLFTFWFLEQRQYYIFGLFLMLVLFCKENMAMIVFILGVYIALIQKKKKFGTLLALVGIGIFILNIWIIIPYYRKAVYGYAYRYSYLGDSIPEIIQTLFFHPIYVIKHALTAKKIKYIIELFGPLGGLSFLSPSHIFLTFPTLLQNILSDFGPQYSIRFQYSSPLTPFIFISAIYGSRNLLINPKIQRYLGSRVSRTELINGMSVILLLLCLLFFGKSPIYYLRQYQITKHTKITDKLLNLIPSKASVSAQGPFVPHLSNRKMIYQFPVVPTANKIEYIFLDTTANKWPISKGEYCRKTFELLQGNYGVVASEDNVLLLKYGHSSIIRKEDILSQLCEECQTTECQ